MRRKLFIYFSLYFLVIGLYTFLSIRLINRDINENALYTIKNVAKSTKFIYPKNYFNKGTQSNKIDNNIYLDVNSRLADFIEGTEINKIYTLVYYGSNFYYTSYADKENGKIEYFQKFMEDDSYIFDIFKDYRALYKKNNHNFNIYIPYNIDDFSHYILCIEYSSDYIDKRIKEREIRFFAYLSVLLLITIMLPIIFKATYIRLDKMEKELLMVKKVKRTLSKDKHYFEEKSKLDSLTKIYNKEEINKIYIDLCHNFSRTPFVVMFLDLDKFKEINDTYGHEIGDRVILQVTKEVNKKIIEDDAFGRIGGDEFMIIFYNTDLARGKDIAKKIVEGVNEIEIFHNSERVKVTCSIGIMQYFGQEPTEFLQVVDKNLYKAKESRNTYYPK